MTSNFSGLYISLKDWRTSISIFVIIALLYILITFIMSSFVYKDELFFMSLSERLSQERILAIIDFNRRSSIVAYFILPVYLIVKFFLVAGIIYVGAMFFNRNIKYAECYRVVLVAEFIPLLVGIIKTCYFLSHAPKNILEVQSFYPLSVCQLFRIDQHTPGYLISLAQQVSVFEVLYWVVLALGIKVSNKTNFKQALTMVAVTYGTALILWLLLLLFIQLQFG